MEATYRAVEVLLWRLCAQEWRPGSWTMRRQCWSCGGWCCCYCGGQHCRRRRGMRGLGSALVEELALTEVDGTTVERREAHKS